MSNLASFWVERAATALDCAVQLGAGEEADRLERECDELVKKLKAAHK